MIGSSKQQTKTRKRWSLKPSPKLSRGALVTRAPIDKLPNELLLIIFSHYIPDIQYNDMLYGDIKDMKDNHTLNTNKPPWSLALVCRRWYPLVTTCPEIWATIILPPAVTPLEAKLVPIQLSRSKNSALSIYVSPPISWSYNSHLPLTTLIRMIFEEHHRCKAIHLPYLAGYYHDPHLWTLLEDRPFPLLEGLHCHVHTLCHYLPNISPQLFPRLRTATFCGHEGVTSVPNVQLPLTELTLTGVKEGVMSQLLRICSPSLRTLKLHHIYRDGYAEPRTTIVLPELCRLELENVERWASGHLHHPQLEDLVVIHPTTSILLTSFCQVTSADLPWYPDSHDLTSFLRVADLLVRLVLRGQPVVQMVPQVLKRTEQLLDMLGQPSICPRLVHFSMDPLAPHPRILQQMVEFLRFVQSRSQQLKYASLHAQHHLMSDITPPSQSGVSREEVKNQVEQLRNEYPSVELHVTYEYETLLVVPGYKRFRFKKSPSQTYHKLEVETW